MSGPDEAMLTAQERAALASLEARAAADDPRLSDSLRGLRQKERLRAVPKPDIDWCTAHVSRIWSSLRPMLWGPVLTVAGLVAIVVGLAVSLVLSVAGVAVAAIGVSLLVQVTTGRLEELRRQQAEQHVPTPD